MSPVFLLSKRLDLAKLGTCWATAGRIPGDPALGSNEAQRLNYYRIIYRLMFMVDGGELGTENVATYFVNTPCSFCVSMDNPFIPEVKANWQTEFPRREDYDLRFKHLWEMPGGGRDRFQKNEGFHLLRTREGFGGPDAAYGTPREVYESRVNAEWDIFQRCFGETPPSTQAEMDECFPKRTEDLDSRRWVLRSTNFPNSDIKYAFWTELHSMRGPQWRIRELELQLAQRIEALRRSHREKFRNDLRSGAMIQTAPTNDDDEGLGNLLNSLDAALAELRTAIEIGFSYSVRTDDDLRGLLYGREHLLGSQDVRRIVNQPDPEFRQLETLSKILAERASHAGEILNRDRAPDRPGRVSELVRELSATPSTSALQR